jgi:alpha,alpha-trehalase
VAANFTVPADGGANARAAEPATSAPRALSGHIDALWDTLTRRPAEVPPYSTLLPLPRPFVVPGGRFREIYYWDSYFTMLGLVQSGRSDLAQDMVSDFAHLIDTYGHIPNGNRTYYLSRSQPPFFFAMVGLLEPELPQRAFARYLPQLRREYAFWMDGTAGARPGTATRRVVSLEGGVVLNRYWDDSDLPRDESYREDTELARKSGRDAKPFYRDVRAAAESGWDFSSRWLADAHTLASIDTTEIVPVDLNSLLFGLERAILSGCKESGDRRCATEFTARAAARRAAMNRYLWDTKSGAYLDYDWTHRQRIPRLTAAMLYPLFTHAASAAQATAVARNTRQKLLKSGGLITTNIDTGQQWDAPNGWAPLQWIAVAGLNAYGESPLAEEIACRWTVNVARAYRESGKLMEKYDVVDTGRPGGGGEYPTQDGFGWTNGVTRKFLAMYPQDAAYRSPDECRPNRTPVRASR